MDERVTKKKTTRRSTKSSPKKKSVTKKSSGLSSVMEIEGIFELIAEYTYDWELLLDVSGQIVWTNQSIKRMMGYTPEEYKKMRKFPNTKTFVSDKKIEQFISNSFQKKTVKSLAEHAVGVRLHYIFTT